MNIIKKLFLFLLLLFFLVACNLEGDSKKEKKDDDKTKNESVETQDVNVVFPKGKSVSITDAINSDETRFVYSSTDCYCFDGKISLPFFEHMSGADIYLNVVNPTAETITNIPEIITVHSDTNNFIDNYFASNIDVFDYRPHKKHIPIDYWNVNLTSKEGLIAKKSDDISREVIGSKKGFLVSVQDKDDEDNTVNKNITATCKYKKTVDTANGERVLLVYLDDSVSAQIDESGKSINGVPTDADISVLAGSFLRTGLDNDIYDKMTEVFGNDIGIFNAHSSNSYLRTYPDLANYFISNNDYITILIADIDSYPDSGATYVGGYFHPGNNYLSTVYKDGTNERSMIVLNAFATGGDYMSSSLATLSHEFQHLIHNQYYNQLGSDEYLSIEGHKKADSANTNEMFSAIAEAYTSYYIAAKTGQVVDSPFMVGRGGFEKGYIDGTEDEFEYMKKNGRGPFTLYSVGNNVTSWNDKIEDYGLVSGLANYLLVNYGYEIISQYMKNGEVDLSGIISAINTLDTSRTLDIKTFLLEYGDALLLSSNPNTSKPYSYNREGFYIVNNLPVYSTNLWLYRYGRDDRKYGFQSSKATSYAPYSVNVYKVKQNVNEGDVPIEIDVGISFDNRLLIDIVVVVNNEDIQSEEIVDTEVVFPKGKVVSMNDEISKSDYVLSSSSYTINDGILSFNLADELNGADIYLNVVNPGTKEQTDIPTITSINSNMNKTNIMNNVAYFPNTESSRIHIPISCRKVDLKSQVTDKMDNNIMKKSDISLERVGTKKRFHIVAGDKDYSKTVTATCKYKKTVETANGERTILVYLDDNAEIEVDESGKSINGVPTDEDISILASSFLRTGLDNDIYDKMTAVFGNDIGIFNAHSSNPYVEEYPDLAKYCISNNDYITILIADNDNNPSTSSSYVVGYYHPNNNYLSEYSYNSNERAMIVLNAYAVAGKYMSESLTTLAHEFQHLIHDQYFNQAGGDDFLSIEGHKEEDSTNMDETFSSIAEFYTAYYIQAKTGQTVKGPYLLGTAAFQKGYLEGNEKVEVEEDGLFILKEFNDYIATSGRGPYTLSTIGYDLAFWGDKKSQSLYNYGLVAGIANYLLVNYGEGVISEYMKAGKPKLSGIISAINKLDTSRVVDIKTFLLEYGDALLLSSNSNTAKPYSYNCKGFYTVNNMPIYSTNLWLYREKNKDTSGFGSSSATSYKPCSVNFYKVKENATAGKNEIFVGSFDHDIAIDVVVVI